MEIMNLRTWKPGITQKEYSFEYEIVATVGNIGERTIYEYLSMPSGEYEICHNMTSGGAKIEIQASGIYPGVFNIFVYPFLVIISIITIKYIKNYGEEKTKKPKASKTVASGKGSPSSP